MPLTRDRLGAICNVDVKGASQMEGVKFIIAEVTEKGRKSAVLRASNVGYHMELEDSLGNWARSL